MVYLATRHFGLKHIGVVFGTMAIAMAVGTSLGPVSAGAVYDQFGSYSNFLLLIFPLVTLGAILIGTLGPFPDHGRAA